MFCEQCGKEVKDDAKFCGECGWAIDAAPVQNAQPAVLPKAAPPNQNTVPYSQNVPAGKKSNNVFIILAILFIAAGMILTVVSYSEYQQWFSPDTSLSKWDRILNACRSYLKMSLPATSVILIGILFSIISLYRKPDKKYFWLSISPCILLALWNVFFWLGSVF